MSALPIPMAIRVPTVSSTPGSIEPMRNNSALSTSINITRGDMTIRGTKAIIDPKSRSLVLDIMPRSGLPDRGIFCAICDDPSICGNTDMGCRNTRLSFQFGQHGELQVCILRHGLFLLDAFTSDATVYLSSS
jgi:hypothetical protein